MVLPGAAVDLYAFTESKRLSETAKRAAMPVEFKYLQLLLRMPILMTSTCPPSLLSLLQARALASKPQLMALVEELERMCKSVDDAAHEELDAAKAAAREAALAEAAAGEIGSAVCGAAVALCGSMEDEGITGTTGAEGRRPSVGQSPPHPHPHPPTPPHKHTHTCARARARAHARTRTAAHTARQRTM